MKELYDVYRVHYLTYEEVQKTMAVNNATFEAVMAFRERVAYGLPLADAKVMVDKLGFGYSMHPTK